MKKYKKIDILIIIALTFSATLVLVLIGLNIFGNKSKKENKLQEENKVIEVDETSEVDKDSIDTDNNTGSIVNNILNGINNKNEEQKAVVSNKIEKDMELDEPVTMLVHPNEFKNIEIHTTDQNGTIIYNNDTNKYLKSEDVVCRYDGSILTIDNVSKIKILSHIENDINGTMSFDIPGYSISVRGSSIESIEISQSGDVKVESAAPYDTVIMLNNKHRSLAISNESKPSISLKLTENSLRVNDMGCINVKVMQKDNENNWKNIKIDGQVKSNETIINRTYTFIDNEIEIKDKILNKDSDNIIIYSGKLDK